MTLTFGSLFAGIGGIDLGFERAGMVGKWQVEIDPYARRVLAKHWPGVRRHDDIRTFPPEPIDDWRVDVIAGGFPCQDISYAGKGAGLHGKRSGLFFELIRVVRVLGPRIIVLENVAALLTRGLDQVLGTLASLGYDAEWHCIPAAAVGAPHIRDRVFIHAYSESQSNGALDEKTSRMPPGTVANAASNGRKQEQPIGRWSEAGTGAREEYRSWRACEDVSDAHHTRLEIGQVFGSDAKQKLAAFKRSNREQVGGIWSTEPDVGRVVARVPARVDRLRGLGNAVVPQVAEFIGRQIVEHFDTEDHE